MKNTFLLIGIIISFYCKAQDYNWTIYNTTNSPLQCNEVRTLAVDHDSSIWLGACDVIYKFKNGNWTVYDSTAIGHSLYRVNQIAVDTDNNKWFATLYGLVKYDNNLWTVYDTTNSEIPSDNVQAIIADNDNLLWISLIDAPGGFYTFDGTTWNIYNEDTLPELYGAGANRIAIDNNNKKYYASAGLYTYNDTTWTWEIIYYDMFNQVGGISSVDINNDNVRWLSLDTRLRKYDNNSYTDYGLSNTGIPMQGNQRVAFDSTGNVWAGGVSRRLIRFDGNNWTEYLPSNSPFPTNGGQGGAYIHDIVVSPTNVIYVATIEGGLVILEESPLSNNSEFIKALHIYPNPAHDFIKLNFNNTLDDFITTVVDINGTEINVDCQKNNSSYYTICVKDLADGVYYLKIKQKDFIKYKLFIKM